MTTTPSSCRQETKSRRQKFIRTGIIYLVAFFSISIIGLWVFAIRNTHMGVALLGAGYALLCTAFLAAQLVAFVRAHLDYDQTIEYPKFELLEVEEKEWAHQA
ncbi:MAG: hypothetical protein H7A33_00810 [Deltaproteobacteria bacterium]|nr:hypothetical protein [Deltaproteobacteria bacterium]